ncbi:MAG TPA: hypothetical protein VN843_14220 [Anaerolineales bacterium]|nr:hypothetical protein [Anaerolineales bacterium]
MRLKEKPQAEWARLRLLVEVGDSSTIHARTYPTGIWCEIVCTITGQEARKYKVS